MRPETGALSPATTALGRSYGPRTGPLEADGRSAVPGGGGEGSGTPSRSKSPFLRSLTAAARSFVLVVVPLLFLAACIEAFITPLLR